MSCARPKEAPEKLQSAIAFAMSDWSALFTNGFEDWAGVVASSQTLGGCHLRSVERLAQRPSLRKLRLSAGTQLLDVYDRHQVDTSFIKANYKEALRNLEANGQIKTDPPAPKRKMIKGQRSFADDVIVTFP
jgi:hypothetical protein